MVAHPLWERGAAGSNPATPTQAERRPSLLESAEAKEGVGGAKRRTPRLSEADGRDHAEVGAIGPNSA